MNVRTRAEAFARALELGVIPTEEVTRWIDESIASEASPLPELCVVSTITDRAELATALRSIPGEINAPAAQSLLFGHMHRALTEDAAFAKCVAAELFRMARSDEAPSRKAQNLMFTFYVDLDLAQLGHAGDRDHPTIVDELRTFLATHSEAV